MNIAIIAPPFLNIPPTKQGGTEQLLSVKIRELVRRGHKVTLFHAGTADFRGIHKVQIYKKAINDLPQDLASQESSQKLRLEMTYFSLVATEIIKTDGQFDVIFNHTRGEVAFAPLTRFLKTPIISVFHLPILEGNILALKENPKAYAISISNNQRSKFRSLKNFIATVYNGVDMALFSMLSNPTQDFLLWVGTIGQHKNPIDAILAAKMVKMPLIMLGKIRDKDYFEEIIKPHVDNKYIKYLGEVDFKTKLPYFQNAKAALFPTLWPEPFGLVMIEALACGTPVIAYPNGAVPEVIDNGQVGYVVKNYKQMAGAIKKIDKIDRAACRQHVRDHFSAEVMVNNYLAAAAAVMD